MTTRLPCYNLRDVKASNSITNPRNGCVPNNGPHPSPLISPSFPACLKARSDDTAYVSASNPIQPQQRSARGRGGSQLSSPCLLCLLASRSPCCSHRRRRSTTSVGGREEQRKGELIGQWRRRGKTRSARLSAGAAASAAARGGCCWAWRWGSSFRCSSPPPASPPPSSPAEVRTFRTLHALD